jgi:cellulose synthase/poly-beta-1,6-N-acetylglucosamine synthase-like glycosyltransferase/peptidoglycan/xylan/chitin deacetylase (PgdA/CDA1 family)
VLAVFLIMLFGISLWALPQVHALVNLPDHLSTATVALADTHPKNADQVEAAINYLTIPIIGNGPFVRIVRVESGLGGKVAIDPFTLKLIRLLSNEEGRVIGTHKYAVERYGATFGKRIALTFDDGPDPRFTPAILDLLSKENAPATFFAMGSNIVRYPELIRRVASEGHTIGNHTFTHADIDEVSFLRAKEEINLTSRVIRATLNQYTTLFRPPYSGADDRETRLNLGSILRAQELGYVVTSFTIDSHDWRFSTGLEPTLPIFSGGDEVILLHDAGGDRTTTIAYLERLIAKAKTEGYSFVSLDQLYAGIPGLTGSATPTFADRAALNLARAVVTLPGTLQYFIFLVSAILVALVSFTNMILAYIQSRRMHQRSEKFRPFVSVVIPAYNEERVIGKTIESILASDYANLEVLVVDDGSTDKTYEIARSFESTLKVKGLRKKNGGKASALNFGFLRARGDIVVTLDADTVFAPDTISRLVQHFSDKNVGAVAGMVKVGNMGNIVTRWQALEYVAGIGVDRQAQSLLNAVVIVPGACAAWRRSAVIEAGGHSAETLAEDCDLTLAIHKTGYRIHQDRDAISFTEAPQTIRALLKQRFRWTFGNIQALWKHRDMLGKRRYGFLGLLVLPYTAITIILPLTFTLFTYVMVIWNIAAGQFGVVLFFFGIFTAVHLVTASVGILLARERLSLLFVVPLYRLIYDPMRIYILYSSLYMVLKGGRVGWNKLMRTGTVELKKALGTRLAHA